MYVNAYSHSEPGTSFTKDVEYPSLRKTNSSLANCDRSLYFMKAIQTSFVQDDMIFAQETGYVVEINGKWFKICHCENLLYDPSGQDSDNICKWDSYGEVHNFTIVECEPPAKDLSAEVREFVERYLVSGSMHAELHIHHKNGSTHPGNTPPASAIEGWSELPPKQETCDDENQYRRGRRG